jgi:hypothetical protein
MKIVNRHRDCMNTILEDHSDLIPLQLLQILKKGHEGLNGYGKLMGNI